MSITEQEAISGKITQSHSLTVDRPWTVDGGRGRRRKEEPGTDWSPESAVTEHLLCASHHQVQRTQWRVKSDWGRSLLSWPHPAVTQQGA